MKLSIRAPRYISSTSHKIKHLKPPFNYPLSFSLSLQKRQYQTPPPPQNLLSSRTLTFTKANLVNRPRHTTRPRHEIRRQLPLRHIIARQRGVAAAVLAAMMD